MFLLIDFSPVSSCADTVELPISLVVGQSPSKKEVVSEKTLQFIGQQEECYNPYLTLVLDGN